MALDSRCPMNTENEPSRFVKSANFLSFSQNPVYHGIRSFLKKIFFLIHI
jgi:hypothetical protein